MQKSTLNYLFWKFVNIPVIVLTIDCFLIFKKIIENKFEIPYTCYSNMHVKEINMYSLTDMGVQA